MPKRSKPPKPVTEEEVSDVVKRAILTAFEGRPLDFDVARRGLAHAAHDLINLELEQVAAKPGAGSRPARRRGP